MPRDRWNEDRILSTLRRLHRQGKDLAYSRLAKTMQPLVSAAAYHFGSYRQAVNKAGIDYSEVTRRPRWSRSAITGLIKDAKRKGQDLHWFAVTRRGDELGRAAFASLQPRLFGSWARALASAGLDASDVARYRRWSRASIVTELRSVHKSRKPLSSGAVQQRDPGLHAAAVRHFGNYDKALVGARLDPKEIRQRQRWTKAKVLQELRQLSRREALTDGMLRRAHPALYGAVLRYFRTFSKAQKAAKK